MKNLKLKICWLFPHHLNIYGDRGNILTLLYRAKMRGIDAEIFEINSRRDKIPSGVNLIFGGGGQDKQQEYASAELQFFKKELHELIFGQQIPALTICGTYQLFGKYFKTFEGREIKGISIFDMVTIASNVRKIGNVVVIIAPTLNSSLRKFGTHSGGAINNSAELLIGFENHSGNTYLKNSNLKTQISKLNTKNQNSVELSIRENPSIRPLGKIVKGFGNNGEDGTEGAIVENCVGTYLHGPILPKNPQLADWLISHALSVGAKHVRPLQPLDDSLELQTREKVIKTVL